MASGDRRSVAERIGRELGVDRVYAEQSPEEKLEVVRRLREDPGLRPVIMVGDGVNDAPALALADLGIAMGVAGATVSSETADAVITIDRIDRVADAVQRAGARCTSRGRACWRAWALAWLRWQSQPPVTSRRSPAPSFKRRLISQSSSTRCALCEAETQSSPPGFGR